jgi:3-isopropylmalate/(R)-2-methylmalate dehydratase large subunit
MARENGTALKSRTIIEKVWDNHVVAERPGAPTLLYIDLHLVHEVTSPQAFSGLRERGLKLRRPDLTIGTTDHSIPTYDRSLPIMDKVAETQIIQFEKNCRDFGIPFFGPRSDKQGIFLHKPVNTEQLCETLDCVLSTTQKAPH